MLGQIVIMPQHRGDTFESTGLIYALCNGQSLPRSTYDGLSVVWPSGAYGSDDTNIVLPVSVLDSSLLIGFVASVLKIPKEVLFEISVYGLIKQVLIELYPILGRELTSHSNQG